MTEKTRNAIRVIRTIANGLPIWDEIHIARRDMWIRLLETYFRSALFHMRRLPVEMVRVEAPVIQPNIMGGDMAAQATTGGMEGLVCRNETTAGSYAAAQNYIRGGCRLPLVVWQTGISVRDEQDFPMRHLRFRAFWQCEFQMFFRADTKDDYFPRMAEYLAAFLKNHFDSIRLTPSDTLPPYSEETIDLVVDAEKKGDEMELASFSRRKDFLFRQPGSGQVIKVAEFAFGLDRLAVLTG